uniref:Metallophos domain-containing protein n=1 Tax=Macrostomum lignano TaxID=282301 RepID=A0A1I8JQV2_9PLAT
QYTPNFLLLLDTTDKSRKARIFLHRDVNFGSIVEAPSRLLGRLQLRTCPGGPPTTPFKQIARDRQFDLIYFTGDLPDHHVWEQTRQEEIALYSGFTQLVQKYFPGVPLVVAMGNHESVPVNSFPPRYIVGNDSMDWLYTKVWAAPVPWIPADQKANVLRWLLGNLTDSGRPVPVVHRRSAGRAEDSGEKVHVLGHIPPNGVIKGYSWNYFKIAEQIRVDNRRSLFRATAHLDNFAVMLDPKPTQTRAFAAISMCKCSANSKLHIQPHEANLAGQGREPVWFLEYNTSVPPTTMQLAFATKLGPTWSAVRIR